MTPASFPRAIPSSGIPSFPGVPLGWFPRFTGSTGCSDFLPSTPRSLVLCLAFPRHEETAAPPRFLKSPYQHAVFFDPGRATAPRSGVPEPSLCLPQSKQRRPPPVTKFRGCITRPAGSLSTLRIRRCRRLRKTRYRLLTIALVGRDFHPLGSIKRFLLSSSRPALSGVLAHSDLLCNLTHAGRRPSKEMSS
jgi:hypothetical protein